MTDTAPTLEIRRNGTARPTVTFVGGVERIERELTRLGDELGVNVEYHDGSAQSHAKAKIGALVHRSDVVVLITGVISHTAVKVAKKEAAKAGVRVVITKSFGAKMARTLLEELIPKTIAAPPASGPQLRGGAPAQRLRCA